MADVDPELLLASGLERARWTPGSNAGEGHSNMIAPRAPKVVFSIMHPCKFEMPGTERLFITWVGYSG